MAPAELEKPKESKECKYDNLIKKCKCDNLTIDIEKMEPTEPKRLKELRCKIIEIDIEKMEPAELRGLKEFRCEIIEFIKEKTPKNKKKITVCSCEIKCIMKLLKPEKKETSTYWYKGVYAYDPDQGS